MGERDWGQAFQELLQGTPDTPAPQPPQGMWQSGVPDTGFLGIQRTQQGWPATWMNMGTNMGGMEWLIPLLQPHLTQEDLATLLSGTRVHEMPDEQRQRIQDGAQDFARQYEQQNPGTFPKFHSILDSIASAMGAGKQMIVRPLPQPTGQYPGRPGTAYTYPTTFGNR